MVTTVVRGVRAVETRVVVVREVGVARVVVSTSVVVWVVRGVGAWGKKVVVVLQEKDNVSDRFLRRRRERELRSENGTNV